MPKGEESKRGVVVVGDLQKWQRAETCLSFL